MANPYVVERPLQEGDLFVGRYSLLVDVMQTLKRGRQMVVVYGPTRIGRTSFLQQLARDLGPTVTCLHVNLEWPVEGGVEQAFAQLQMAVQRGLSSTPGWGVPASLAAGGPAESATPAGEGAAATTPTTRTELKVAVLLDGLSGAHLEGEQGAAWVAACQSWLTAVPWLRLVMAVEASRPLGSSLFSPALTSLASVELVGFTLEETEDLLFKPVQGRMSYEFEAARRIWQLTRGHPYFVQLYGHVLYEAMAGGGRVSEHDVQRTLEVVVKAGRLVMERIWQSCSPQAQVTLALANELRGRHGIVSVPELQTLAPRFNLPLTDVALDAVVAELQARGILHQLSAGGYRFSLELFREWLQKSGKTLSQVLPGSGYKTAPSWPSRLERSFRWSNVVLGASTVALLGLVLVLWSLRGAAQRSTLGSSPTATSAPFATRATLVIGPVMGDILYMAKDDPDATWDIWRMRGDGSEPHQLTEDPSNDIYPAWSSSGRNIAFVSDRDGNREIYVMKVDGTQQINVTHHAAEDWTPAWSPDGTTIAFASYRDGNWEIYTMNADGNDPQRLTRNGEADYAPCWSPDGRSIAFQSNRDGNWEIYVMNRDGTDQRRLTEDEATDSAPAWSPDGQIIAFESYRDGNMEIYLMATDGSDQRNLSDDVYSNEHGPAWARNGARLLYYSNRDGGWDLYSMNPDGTERSNLTLSPAFEQKPSWHE